MNTHNPIPPHAFYEFGSKMPTKFLLTICQNRRPGRFPDYCEIVAGQQAWQVPGKKG
jgi:hypothetical protein